MTLITSHDVLCGKDKTYENHPGNQLYRNMIIATAPRYAITTSKQDKMQMTSTIVSTLMTEYGSRFLKLSSTHNEWETINIAAARDKTSHALRFCAAQMVPSSSSSSSSSGKQRPSKTKGRSTARKTHRRKVSFDEAKMSKCVSPDTTMSSTITFQNNNDDNNIPSSLNNILQPILNDQHESMTSTWCIPDITKSTHDLSTETNNYHYQQQQLQPQTNHLEQHQYQLQRSTISSSSNSNIDLLWSFQMHNSTNNYTTEDDDDFDLIFEEGICDLKSVAM